MSQPPHLARDPRSRAPVISAPRPRALAGAVLLSTLLTAVLTPCRPALAQSAGELLIEAAPPELPTRSGSGLPGVAVSGMAEGLPAPPAAAPLDLDKALPVVDDLSQPPEAIPLSTAAREAIVGERSRRSVGYEVVGSDGRIIVLDVPDVLEQARLFARIVLLVEREGAPRHRVLDKSDALALLARLQTHFATMTVGNNLRGRELARFFNTARLQGETLTRDEFRLFRSLIDWQVLRETVDGIEVVRPEKIVISIPQVSRVAGCPGCSVGPLQRAAVFEHEYAHALFATDDTYHDYTIWFWHNGLSDEMRARFVAFLGSRGYDTGNDELMANEMQAFMLHTPEQQFFAAPMLGLPIDGLDAVRDSFRAGLGSPPALRVDIGYRFDEGEAQR